MEDIIEKLPNQISGNPSTPTDELTVLTKSALEIANIAFTSLNGGLRDRALEIAKAIVDFEDEQKLSH